VPIENSYHKKANRHSTPQPHLGAEGGRQSQPDHSFTPSERQAEYDVTMPNIVAGRRRKPACKCRWLRRPADSANIYDCTLFRSCGRGLLGNHPTERQPRSASLSQAVVPGTDVNESPPPGRSKPQAANGRPHSSEWNPAAARRLGRYQYRPLCGGSARRRNTCADASTQAVAAGQVQSACGGSAGLNVVQYRPHPSIAGSPGSNSRGAAISLRIIQRQAPG